MFQLNPYRLTDASLWHFLMLQGIALLAYLLARQVYLARQRAKEQLLRALQERIAALRAVQEPEWLPEETGRDDLKEVAGINLKVESILNAVGIFRFGQLAATPVETLRTVLENHGPLLFSFDPATWAGQATLAATGRWAELRAWQEEARRGIDNDIGLLVRDGPARRKRSTRQNGTTYHPDR